MLQLADISATSLFLAYEINYLGFRTPCFITTWAHHFYKYNGQILKYGIKYFSSDMQLSPEELLQNLVCK